IEEVFKRVRSGVQNLTGGTQVPWESSSLVGDFYFVSGAPEMKGLTTTESGRLSGFGESPTEMITKNPVLESKKDNRSSLSSTAAEVFVNQGDAAAKQKRWPQAEAEYRQAVDLDPSNARLRVKLGNALSQQKKWDEAAAQYTVAVRLEPQNSSFQD